ncbi:MAG: hypothetical protein Ta2E_01850 [Mycoplasmoidaceae bacterium]|nr:MAG: hypothetical protein Ta2E_01850 [Mycoplasmoidaceae bacterium]
MTYFGDDNSALDEALDFQFQSHYITNLGKNVSLSKISEIGPSTPYMYHSVNVFIGRRSSCKIFTYIKEFIQNFKISKRTRLLVYITKNPNIINPTFHELRTFMNFPIIFFFAENDDKFINI